MGDWETKAFIALSAHFPRLEADPDPSHQALVPVIKEVYRTTRQYHERMNELQAMIDYDPRLDREVRYTPDQIAKANEQLDDAVDLYYAGVDQLKELLMRVDAIVSPPAAGAAAAPAAAPAAGAGAPAPAAGAGAPASSLVYVRPREASSRAGDVPEILTVYVAELERSGNSALREALDAAAATRLSPTAEARLEGLISAVECTPERRALRRRLNQRVVPADRVLPFQAQVALTDLERGNPTVAEFQERLQDLAARDPVTAIATASYHQEDMHRVKSPNDCAVIGALARTVLRPAAARLNDRQWDELRSLQMRFLRKADEPDPEPLGAPPAVVAGGRLHYD